jgi:cell division protein ZapA
MAHVSVSINGRQYRMACEEGQEDHLVRLSQDLDQRIAQLRENFGDIGEARLIVMAALSVGDDLADARRRIRRLEDEVAALQEERTVASDRTQAAVVAALNAAAERIERVTKGLNKSLGDGVAIG